MAGRLARGLLTKAPDHASTLPWVCSAMIGRAYASRDSWSLKCDDNLVVSRDPDFAPPQSTLPVGTLPSRKHILRHVRRHVRYSACDLVPWRTAARRPVCRRHSIPSLPLGFPDCVWFISQSFMTPSRATSLNGSITRFLITSVASFERWQPILGSLQYQRNKYSEAPSV
jgi:hypothetical protein